MLNEDVREVVNVLDQIDRILARGRPAAPILWNILTGLRSWDHQQFIKDFGLPSELKGPETCVVRSLAFPKTHESYRHYLDFRVPASFSVERLEDLQHNRNPISRVASDTTPEHVRQLGEHYAAHYLAAMRALAAIGRCTLRRGPDPCL